MSSIVISDLNQESTLTDLSDEQIGAIQGGFWPAVAAVAAVIFVAGVVVGGSGQGCTCQ